jgi:Na+-transporting methylmalonyl-CoA/oxaloacetate decarboxylase gamma subunit
MIWGMLVFLLAVLAGLIAVVAYCVAAFVARSEPEPEVQRVDPEIIELLRARAHEAQRRARVAVLK